MKISKIRQISLIVLVIAFVLTCSMVFVACGEKANGGEPSQEVVTHYVTIHPNNGDADIKWAIGDEIPTILKEGYIIEGIYLDSEFTNLISLTTYQETGLNEDIEVYVKWTQEECKHTIIVTDSRKEPTCLNTGLTEGSHCATCNKVIVAQQVIDALDHDIIHHNRKNPTCTEIGWDAYDTCSRCSYTTYVEKKALNHAYVFSEIVWTDYTAKAIYVCSNDGNHTEEHNCAITSEVTSVPTCKATGVRQYTATYDGHTSTKDETLAENQDNHNITNHNAQAPTCTEKGWDAYDTCSRCNYTTYVEKKALGHDWDTNWTTDKEQTCLETGSKSHHCTRCTEKKAVTELSALGHSYTDGVCIRCKDLQTKGLSYVLSSDSSYYIVNGIGTCTDTDIHIPITYENKPVKEIKVSAFKQRTNLTSITIPNSVTSIGIGAFSGCNGLTSITIPDSVTSIGNSAFYECSSLKSITIGSGVKSIEFDTFKNCRSLTSITIPDSVTIIGSMAFNSCIGLTSITIPDSVTSIPKGTFYNCGSLTSITIPFVGDRAGVTSDDTYQFTFGYIFGTDSYTGGTAVTQDYYVSSASSAATYYIPSSLRSVTVTGGYIPYGAFQDCSMLTYITLGDSVTSIGNSVFYGCSSLNSITIGSGVTSIGNDVFKNCTGLKTIKGPADIVSSIAKQINANASSYSVVITSGTSIDNEAFKGCSNLTSVTISGSLVAIGESAFYGCSSLTSVTIPKTIRTIGQYAFSGCSELKTITFNGTSSEWGNVTTRLEWDGGNSIAIECIAAPAH